MLGIGFGHAIDPVLMVTGELRDVVATLEASAADHRHIAPPTVRGRHGGRRMATLRPPAAYDAFPSLAGTAIHTLAHA